PGRTPPASFSSGGRSIAPPFPGGARRCPRQGPPRPGAAGVPAPIGAGTRPDRCPGRPAHQLPHRARPGRPSPVHHLGCPQPDPVPQGRRPPRLRTAPRTPRARAPHGPPADVGTTERGHQGEPLVPGRGHHGRRWTPDLKNRGDSPLSKPGPNIEQRAGYDPIRVADLVLEVARTDPGRVALTHT